MYSEQFVELDSKTVGESPGRSSRVSIGCGRISKVAGRDRAVKRATQMLLLLEWVFRTHGGVQRGRLTIRDTSLPLL